jgi:hypothetical protein
LPDDVRLPEPSMTIDGETPFAPFSAIATSSTHEAPFRYE